MPKTIQQKVKFNIPPEELFEIYINPKRHSVACGYKTYVSRKVGANFSVPPYLFGKNLFIIPQKMIVQSWRESDWKESDLDSILILYFSKVKGGGQIHLVHVNLPDKVYKTINKGWHRHYWNPWRKYIRKEFRRR